MILMRLPGESIRDHPLSGVSVLEKAGRTGVGPGIYHVHGGGMITGDRFIGVDVMLDWIEAYNGVCVTVEYRLAPESPIRTPSRTATPAFCGQRSMHKNSASTSIGSSWPALAGQLLMCAMLDDHDATTSTHQIDGVGTWDRGSNLTGWSATR